MPTYHDFTITLHASPQGYELTAHGPGEIAVPPQPLPAEVAAQLHAAAIQTSAALSGDEMKSAGAQFYRALFPPAVASAFAAAQQVVAPAGSLRLRLALYPPELNALSWELLYHPEQERFLAALLTQPVVRYIESATPAAPLRAEKPLRLLYVQSMPADLPPLDLEASERALRQALGGAAEITTLRQPTPQALQDALRQPFHALHYDGHAYFDETSSALLLTDGNGNASPLRSADLAYALNGTTIRLVVLAACQSGMDARRARFSGLAHELMKASDLPAVVAMQDSISDAAALAFTRGFYRALADEYPLDAAVTEGRKAILSAAGGELTTAEWATPVVFLRGDGQLFALPEDAPAPGVSPYKGLQYFDEADADLFFGRAQLSQSLTERLRAGRFLAVVGASGSGKSSLVRAGLLPQLRQAGGWAIVPPFTPAMGSEPLQALAAALIPLLEPALGELDRLAEAQKLTVRLKASEISLREVAGRIAQKQGAARLAVVVDQFEELFTTFRDKTPLQAEFVEVLLSAAEGDSPLTVILTLRADFYASCAQFGGLRAALENHQAFIGPMTCDELRQAIEEPARRGDWQLEDGLVEMLLRDVGDEPGNLPLLSHALLETWQRRKGRTLTLQGYQQSGGVSGAIARTADSVFGGLNAEQQAVARRIFLGLTELGEGTQDTRRRAALEEIAPQADGRPAVEAVLKLLADARLVTTSEQAAEVAHEALIREWPALRRWLDEDRASLRLHRELNEDAREWAGLKRDAGALYRGARLAAAAEWAAAHAAELTPLEGEFLHASQQAVEQEEREREAQRQRELQQAQQLVFMQRQRATVLAISLVVALVLTALAVGFMFNARENLGKANVANTQAAENLQAAQQNAATATNALGLSEQRGTQAAENAATAQANEQQANQQRGTAEAERARAEEQAQIAFSRQLAAQAQQIYGVETWKQPLAVLLAIRSIQIFPSLEASQILLNHTLALPVSRITRDTPVDAVAYSPDGRFIVLGGMDGAVQVWEASSGKETAHFSHEGRVTFVAFSPDGRSVITGSEDKTVRVWEISSGKELARVTHNDRILFIVVSPDGKYVISSEGCEQGDEDGFYCTLGGARVWEAATGQDVVHITNDNFISSAAFSPDGELVVSGGGNGVVQVWKIATGQEVGRMTHGMWVSSVAFSPNGNYIAAAGCEKSPAGSCTQGFIQLWFAWDENWAETWEDVQISQQYNVDFIAFRPDGLQMVSRSGDDGSARLWDVSNGQEILRIASTLSVGMASIAFSADGRSLVSRNSSEVYVWDTSSGQEVAHMSHFMDVTSAAFSPDSKFVVSGSIDGVILVWQADRGQVLGHTKNEIETITAGADENPIVAVSDAFTIRVWDLANQQPVTTLSPGSQIGAIAFSPDMRHVAWGEYMGNIIQILETANGQEITRMSHTDMVLSITYSPDGKYVVSRSRDNTVWVWNATSGEKIVHRIYSGDISLATFSPDGKNIFVVECEEPGTDGCLKQGISIWEIATDSEIARLSLPGLVTRLAFSPDGKYLALGGCDAVEKGYWGCTMSPSTAHVWEITTGKEIAQLPHEQEISSLAFSPNGKYLASSSNGTIHIWDTVSGQEIRRIINGGSIVVFSPDGLYLISAATDIHVWETATGREVARMANGGSLFTFSPDGKFVISANGDTVRVWPYHPTDLVTAACLRLPRNLTRAEWLQYIGNALPYQAVCPNLPLEP